MHFQVCPYFLVVFQVELHEYNTVWYYSYLKFKFTMCLAVSHRAKNKRRCFAVRKICHFVKRRKDIPHDEYLSIFFLDRRNSKQHYFSQCLWLPREIFILVKSSLYLFSNQVSFWSVKLFSSPIQSTYGRRSYPLFIQYDFTYYRLICMSSKVMIHSY